MSSFFKSDLDINTLNSTSDVTIEGDLTVSGTTTTVSTTNTVVSDKLIELANGSSGSASGDAGIIVERGSDTNAGLVWDESADAWVACTTSATGASTGDLTLTDAAFKAAAITSSGVVTATGFTIGNAVIAESELEQIDGITAGTVVASKAVVVDVNKDIGTIRNLTIDGTFSDGNYTFDTSGNVSGLGTVGCGAITTSGVLDITNTTDASDASGDTGALRTEGGASIAKKAFVGTDLSVGGDIILDDGGSLKEAGGTAAFTFDGSGNVTQIGVDTQTSGHFLKWNGSKWLAAEVTGTVAGSVAADDISAGDAAINLTNTTGNITIDAQAGDANIIFKGTDGSSDITALTLSMADAGAATFNDNVTAVTVKGTTSLQTPLIEYTDGDNAITIADGGGITAAAGITSTAASNTFGATSFNDADITNVGDIALDSISADGTDINVAVSDNSATALTIKQGSDAYLIVDTADGSESVSIGTGLSGTAISIGHGTSETTVNDNLTVTGDIDVDGTTNLDNTDIDGTFQMDGATFDVNASGLVTVDGAGVSIDSAGEAANFTVASDGAAEDLTIAVTGNTDSSVVISSTGTGADAINIDTTAGSIDIDSADNITIDAADDISITSTSADGLITLHSAHTAGQSILIDANANAGSILDIDAGIIDIDVQDAITIDAADEIVVTTSSADGHISLVSAHTAGVAVHIDANADAGSIVDIDAGILDIDVTGAATIDAAGLTITSDVVIAGATPTLTIGDDGAEDTMLIFDGNAEEFRIGIDDGTDTLEIGVGTAHGTNPIIKIDKDNNCQILYNSAVADGQFSGDVAVFQAGEDLTAGEVVYFKSDAKCWKAVATAEATSRCVAMATGTIAADAMGTFLLKGFARFNSEFPTWTVGGALYTPEAQTNNDSSVAVNVPEQAAPASDGDFVQVIGFAVSGDTVYFDPDSTVVEVA